MKRTEIVKGLNPKTMFIEFRCRNCGKVWNEEREVGNREVNVRGLKCSKCKSSAVSIIYPQFSY